MVDFRRLRIVSDGLAGNTKLFDTEGNEIKIPFLTGIDFEPIRAGNLVIVTLRVENVELDIVAEATVAPVVAPDAS